MTARHTPRRHLRLGPMHLQLDDPTCDNQVVAWLPFANPANDGAPAAAVAVQSEPRPPVPPGKPIWSKGQVSFFAPEGGNAYAYTPSGHARLDLGTRLARVSPGTSVAHAHELLTATSALLLARAGIAMLEASAIADSSGWCWIVLGSHEDRDFLVRAFCTDSARFVSRGRILVHRHPLTPDQVVVESWQAAGASTFGAFETSTADLQRGSGPARWCPLAPLRGIIAAGTQHPGAPGTWRVADRSGVTSLLNDSVFCDGADPQVASVIADLVEACARRVAVHAPLDRTLAVDRVRPLGKLLRALEDHFV